MPYQENGWDSELAQVYKQPREIERPGFLYHRVKRGDTACGVAERYKASCSALKKMNRLNRKSTIIIGQKLKVPTKTGGISVASSSNSNINNANSDTSYISSSTKRYSVQRGESSCLIANRFSMKCAEFLAINGLSLKSILRVGQQVIVSDAGVWHMVKKGQTGCSIARKYKVSCDRMLNANRLTRRSTILIGQRLRIPK